VVLVQKSLGGFKTRIEPIQKTIMSRSTNTRKRKMIISTIRIEQGKKIFKIMNTNIEKTKMIK
jgi:hypothetical protein